MIAQLRHYKNQRGPMLIFQSLITKLCKRVEVEEYSRDNCISLKTLIYLLNMCGEGTTSKSKKKKIDLGKSIDDDLNSCRPPLPGPFE